MSDPNPYDPIEEPELHQAYAAAVGAPLSKSGQPLAEVDRVFLRWLGKDYDLGALHAVLSTAAAEQLGGDPCWLLVVSGSGAAKTETLMPLVGIGATVVSTITGPGALLSGTSDKDRAKDATGGLLRKIGRRGVLVIKDFTSILSMNRDARAEVLAALREVYDGRWHRDIGSDGGKTLTWAGRLVVLGAVTTAWDSAHAVISTMGDRFCLVRIESGPKANRRAAGMQALLNVDSETEMRAELAAAVGKLLECIDLINPPRLTEDNMYALLDLGDIVTLARTAVERDYQGNVVQAHAAEMPTRFVKQLAQIARGALAIGMSRPDALALAARCAGDSMPPMRLAVLLDVAANPCTRTSEVTKRVQFPRKTVDRVLQELHLLGLLTVDEEPRGESVRWLYTLAESINREALQLLARNGEGDPQVTAYPTVTAKRATTFEGVTTWTIDCPYCGREHTHSASPGHRVSHCHQGDGYVLKPPRATAGAVRGDRTTEREAT